MERVLRIFLVILLIITAGLLLHKSEEIVMANTKRIQLPSALIKGKVSLEEAIFQRRSQRNFSKKDLALTQIAQLLWAGGGITAVKQGFHFRAAPSAGALYPLELYLLTRAGLFHYLSKGHELEVLGDKDLRKPLSQAALAQDSVASAPVDIVICTVYLRVTKKYGQRGIRYAHIEAGHVAQNIHLQAVALGLGSVCVGAFNDKEAKSILLLPEDNEPLYIISVGYSLD
jgi:SagB-type dehydrogenase family enzyme